MKLTSATLFLASAMATHGQPVSPDVKGRHSAPRPTKTRGDGPTFTHKTDDLGYVNGKILVSYTSADSLTRINEHVNSKASASVLGDGNVELKSVNKFSRPQQANGGGADGGSRGLRSIESNDPVLGYVVIKTEESNVRHEMGELASIPGVKHVERDHVMHMLDSKMPAGASDGDGRSLLQEEETPWGIDMVNVTHLWDIKPASHIKICVVDGGYDLGHVDLPTGNVTGWNPSSDEEPGFGFWDVDGEDGHGTHVAGTIGAIGGNNEGVVGVNPDPTRFSFHIAKACSQDGFCYYVLEAVQSCVDAGANVISISLGGPSFSEIEELVFQDVYDQDILVIAAAGNSGSDLRFYPASYKTVVSVASVAEGGGEDSDNYGELSGFSTRNDQTEIAAPGSNVTSTIPGNDYDSYSGTSMACPHVSGIAALLWSHFPKCTNNQIRNAMIHVQSVREPPTTDDRNTHGWDKYYGWGIVNAGLAYELLHTKGCEDAGGIYPYQDEKLSSFASGGSQQKSLGCVNDEQCFDANPCLGQMKCNVDDNTCYAVQDTIPCDDGDSCTMNVCTPLNEIVDGMDYMCTYPDKCENGFTCDAAGDQQCVCTTDSIVEVDLLTDDYPDETSYFLTNACTSEEQFSKAGFDSNNTLYQDAYCLPDARYAFTIQDTFGDGICCTAGSGSYNVTYKGDEVASGGTFGLGETTSFGSFDACPTPPPCDSNYVTVGVVTDGNPDDTSYRLTNTCTGKEQFFKAEFGREDMLYQDAYCVPDDAAYDFTIEDTNGDGLWSYAVTYKGAKVASGGSFGYDETTSFGTCPPSSKSRKATTTKSGKAPGASAESKAEVFDRRE